MLARWIKVGGLLALVVIGGAAVQPFIFQSQEPTPAGRSA